MIKPLFSILLALSMLFSSANAYNDRLDFGTLSSGMAGADVAFPSTGAGLLLNPAFPHSQHRYSVSFHLTNHHNIPGLNSHLTTLKYHGDRFSAGFESAQFGKENLYIEQNYRFAGGMSFFKNYYAGLMVDLLSLDIGTEKNYGSFKSFGFSGGYQNGAWGLAGSISGLELAAKNVGKSEVNRLYLLGVFYRIRDFTSLYSCFGSHSSSEWVSLGQSFIVGEKVSMHIGLKSNPATPSLGVSAQQGSFSVAYSYRYHPVLGDTHQAGLTINFKRKTSRYAKN